MKKLLIPCVAAAVLLTGSVSAGADELPYIRELPQYSYVRATLLSQESYPEIRLHPGYAYSLFSDYQDEAANFLCFPGPDGALAESFSMSDAYYLDDANAIQYSYYVTSSDSYEEFVNEATDPAWVLKDGSDGIAVRVDPDRLKGYGMIGTPEFGASAKLLVQVGLDRLDRKMPAETLVQSLSDAILAEVDRISQSMHYETMEPYWSAGKYAGIKFLDYDFEQLLKVDFPVISVNDQDGNAVEAPFIPTEVGGTDMDGIIDFGNGAYIEVEIEFSDYSYAASKLEENDPEAVELTVENGGSWLFYTGSKRDDGTFSLWYASKKLGIQNSYGDDIYLSISFNGNGVSWTDAADAMKDIAKFDSAVLMNAADDPYVPQEAPAAEAAPAEGEAVPAAEAAPAEGEAAPAEGTWVCPECQQENIGNFCSNCGAKRP